MDIADLYSLPQASYPAAARGMSEAEQNSRLKELFGAPLTVLGGIGAALDTYSGASSIRDIIAGENPFDQFIDPLNETKRISGRDMARDLGLVGRQDTWGTSLVDSLLKSS